MNHLVEHLYNFHFTNRKEQLFVYLVSFVFSVSYMIVSGIAFAQSQIITLIGGLAIIALCLLGLPVIYAFKSIKLEKYIISGTKKIPREILETIISKTDSVIYSWLEDIEFLSVRLNEMASYYLPREPDRLLEPTDLANEVFLKLVGEKDAKYENREHFLEHARFIMKRHLKMHEKTYKNSVKSQRNYELFLRHQRDIYIRLEKKFLRLKEQEDLNLLLLTRALKKLASENEYYARIIGMRFFQNLTVNEIAKSLAISRTKVSVDLNRAKKILREEITREGTGDPE